MVYEIKSGSNKFYFDESSKRMYKQSDLKELIPIPFRSIEKFLKFHPYAELVRKLKSMPTDMKIVE